MTKEGYISLIEFKYASYVQNDRELFRRYHVGTFKYPRLKRVIIFSLYVI